MNTPEHNRINITPHRQTKIYIMNILLASLLLQESFEKYYHLFYDPQENFDINKVKKSFDYFITLMQDQKYGISFDELKNFSFTLLQQIIHTQGSFEEYTQQYTPLQDIETVFLDDLSYIVTQSDNDEIEVAYPNSSIFDTPEKIIEIKNILRKFQKTQQEKLENLVFQIENENLKTLLIANVMKILETKSPF